MKQIPSENDIKFFECQIKDQIKYMHNSPFIHSLVYSYDKRSLTYRFPISIRDNHLLFHINLVHLHWVAANERVGTLEKMDEISNIIALKIVDEISYPDMCYLLQQDNFLSSYIQEGELLIKVINGAYKSSEIRAIHPQLLFTSNQEQ